jgi:hypothetical protein
MRRARHHIDPIERVWRDRLDAQVFMLQDFGAITRIDGLLTAVRRSPAPRDRDRISTRSPLVIEKAREGSTRRRSGGPAARASEGDPAARPLWRGAGEASAQQG